MESVVSKYIMLGLVVALVIGLAVYGIMYVNRGKDMVQTQDENWTNLHSMLSESDLQAYNGTLVSGSDVVSAISRYENKDTCIKVTTGRGTFYYNYVLDANNNIITGTPTGIDKARTVTATEYINPTGNFRGSILRDINDVPTGIAFVQE